MKTPTQNRFCDRGFSMVELMVSMVISLLLLAAISGVMLSTKKSNSTQNALARMQENGRIALQIIAFDVRQAGYFGCAKGIDQEVNNNLKDAASATTGFSTGVPVQGGNGALVYPGGDAVPLGSISDVLGLRYVDGASEIGVIEPYMPQAAGAIQIPTGSGIQVGDILMLSDCSGGDLFEVTDGDPDGTGTLTHNSGTSGTGPGNETTQLSRIYGEGAKIIKFVSRYYFIKLHPTSGQPTLYWQLPGPDPVDPTKFRQEELVEGIERIELTYGIDTDSDGIPDRYVEAGEAGLITKPDWKTVRTVRIGILARALADNTTNDKRGSELTLDSTQYDIDGDGDVDLDATTLSDADRRYHRRVFRTTVWMRNRHN